MSNITQSFVARAQPKDGATETVFFDDRLSGFGLRVKASGSKSYLIQYRNARGLSRRYTVGQHGRLTAKQARKEAKLRLGDVERGKDPAEERNEIRGAMSVRALCQEYLEAAEKGLVLGKRKRPKKASTRATDKGRIDRHVVPLLGKKAVREVTAVDVTRFMRDVASGKTATDVKTDKKRGRAIVKGGAGTAARTVGLLGGIFSYAVSEGLRRDNPVRGIQRPAGGKRNRRLTIEEYGKLGEVLAAAEAEDENPAAMAGVKLLAFTGARLSEIAKLRKTEIDRAGRALVLADSKEGESIRPLSAAAIRVLDSLPEALQLKGCKFVLPSDDGKGSYGGLPKAIDRIVERAPELSGVTAHVLRHSFASLADELGYTEPTVAALLGHRSGSVTRRYVHQVDRVLIAAADRVADLIEAAMAGKAKRAEVAEFPKRSARKNRRG
jgi:integrase